MDYQNTTLIDFKSPVLGTQHAGLKTMRDFRNEIAPCRTFCFLHELEMLLDAGLIKGGDISNAIVYIDKELTPETAEKLKKAFERGHWVKSELPPGSRVAGGCLLGWVTLYKLQTAMQSHHKV